MWRWPQQACLGKGTDMLTHSTSSTSSLCTVSLFVENSIPTRIRGVVGHRYGRPNVTHISYRPGSILWRNVTHISCQSCPGSHCASASRPCFLAPLTNTMSWRSFHQLVIMSQKTDFSRKFEMQRCVSTNVTTLGSRLHSYSCVACMLTHVSA